MDKLRKASNLADITKDILESDFILFNNQLLLDSGKDLDILHGVYKIKK